LESDTSNSKTPDVAQPICHWNAPRNAIRSAAADQMFPRTFIVRWLNYTRVDIFLNSFVWYFIDPNVCIGERDSLSQP